MELTERPQKINIPNNYKYVNIFADCETFIEIDRTLFNDLEEFKNIEYRDKIFRDFGTVVPWLLCFDVPRTGFDKFGKPLKLNGRKIACTLFPHEDFFKLLKQIYDTNHLPLIWFHNTTYDVTSIFPTALKQLDPDATIYMHVKDSNNDFIAGTVSSPKYGFIAVLGDTMKYKKISLKKIGEMFEQPKGQVIYTMANLEIIDGVGYYTNWTTGEKGQFNYYDYEAYCKNDVKLLSQYHGYITNFKKELYNAVLGSGKNPTKVQNFATVGEQAKKMFDCYLYRHLRGNFDDYFRPEVNKLEYYRQYNSNNGGFTSMNKNYPFYRCTPEEKIFYIDINGSYPYVMSQGLPYGRLMNQKPETGNYVTWIRVQINSFEWSGLLKDLTKIAVGSNRVKDLDKPTCTEPDDWHTEKEIYIPEIVFNWLKENAEIKYQYRGKFYQSVTFIARDYMNFVNGIRKEYKERALNHTNKLERLLADEIQKNIKISANSIYGKFCQKTYVDERFYLGDMFADYPKDEEETKYQGVLTGAFITWMGRFKLFKKLLELRKAGFIFLYCDTDSILGVYKIKEIDKLNSIIGINTNELGQWKIEGFFNEFAYLVSKKYMLIDYDNPEKSKFVFSGINELGKWISAFKVGLLNNFEETLKLLRDIYSHEQNWVFKLGKTTSIRTLKYAQTIIRESDFNTNAKLKSKKIRNGIIWLTDEGYEYQRIT